MGSITATITAGSATADPESANNAIPYEASINTQPMIKRVPALNHWMIATLSLILGVTILFGFRKK
ncbi:IPTL-CTERM sorting domain-containing protein [Comamonas sp. MYb69]